MSSRNSYLSETKNKNPFFLFLISQTVSYFGNAFHFIAVTALLIKITGLGTSASFIVVCTPISSLFLSPLAGGLGDRLNEKYLLVFINLSKSLVILAFLLSYNVLVIYMLMLILASLDIMDNPPKKKIIARLLCSKDIMVGNSILTGMTGLAFIIGPVVCGIIIEQWGLDIIFIIDGLLYLFSAIILLFIRNKKYKLYKTGTQIGPANNILDDIRSGIRYFRYKAPVRKVILISTITSLLIASINAAFYSFAFDILKVNNGLWGIMMSLFYGTNLISMFVSIYFNESIQRMDLLFVYIASIIVSGVWFCYSLANSLSFVMLLQFMEGLLLTLITIFLSTKLQLITKREFIGRIVGINDILNNIGKLLSVGTTYFILRFYSARFIFVLDCICLFSCTIAIMGIRFRNRIKL